MLAIKFLSVVDNFRWAIAIVYGPNEDSSRGQFWDDISSAHLLCLVPLCVGGDFNMVRSPQEKRGAASFLSRSMARFSDFIESNEFIDFPISGSKFT